MAKTTKQLVVISQSTVKPNQVVEEVALFNPDGSVLTVVQTTAAMVLTGYTLGANATVSATDTVNAAFGKLQKQITDLTARVVTLESA